VVRVFKNLWFSRFAEKEGISDTELKEAVKRLASGRADADLGGGVYKQRLARSSSGKSGGYRVIVFFKSEDRAFFVYGFAKSDRGNISKKELVNFRKNAKTDFELTDEQIDARLKRNTLQEII
jgi:hypothetical protein